MNNLKFWKGKEQKSLNPASLREKAVTSRVSAIKYTQSIVLFLETNGQNNYVGLEEPNKTL